MSRLKFQLLYNPYNLPTEGKDRKEEEEEDEELELGKL